MQLFFCFYFLEISLTELDLVGSEICSVRIHFYFKLLFFKKAVQLIDHHAKGQKEKD